MSDPFNPEQQLSLRPARAQDEVFIRRIVRSARLFPLALHWRRFMVAEVEGQIVGVGQVKPHADGSRELASLAVVPAFQQRGIGSLLVEALIAGEGAPIFLFCRRGLRGFYRRFGFRLASSMELPWQLSLIYRGSRAGLRLLALLGGPRWTILAMRRDPPG